MGFGFGIDGRPVRPRQGAGDSGYEQSSREARRRAREAAGERRYQTSSSLFAQLPPSPEPTKRQVPKKKPEFEKGRVTKTEDASGSAPTDAEDLASIDVCAANNSLKARLPRDMESKQDFSDWCSPYDVVDRSTLLIWFREELFSPAEVVAKLETAGVHPKAARTAVRLAMAAIGEFY